MMTPLGNGTKTDHGTSGETYENLEKQIRQSTAQLLKANQQLKREIHDRKRAEQITHAFFSISSAVNTTKDLDELYVSIHNILGQVFYLSNFYIALYYKKDKRVTFPYFVDQFDSGEAYADQFSEKNSLTGTVITTQKPVFLDREALKKRAAEKSIIGTVPDSWIGVPLTIKEEVIGIMAAQSYEERYSFDEIDLGVLSSASDQVALAIERKRNEQRIVASEKKYRNIIESIEDGYYEIDLKGNLTLVNQAMSKILGYSSDELLGMNTAEYVSEQTVQVMGESIAEVMTTDLPGKTLELELYRKDGAIRYAETVVSAIRDEDDQPIGFRGIARDITARKNAEESRRVLEKQLQQSQRLESLGTLAGGIAHDFNNLLMGIQGRTALMLNDLSEGHPHYNQLINIEEYVESAASLTNRLLGFARGGKYEVRPVDLNTLVEKSIQIFGRTRREIAINTTLKNDLWSVEVDANQIVQVLVNLLVNAWQAMVKGGVVTIESSHVLVGKENSSFYGIDSGKYVQLKISDTGKGMDKAVMQRIFDPFFTTKRIGHGTGLGLAMVYGIIRNHAGTVSVSSELEKGTTFSILLPATEKAIATPAPQSSTVKKGSGTILLVDDEPMITEIGSKILALLGYDVLTAASGDEAIDIYTDNQDRIVLLILDMIMPGMSGGELFDKLKLMDPTIKVLLCSGYSLDGQAREILNRGCKGFIQKPFTVSGLSVKIRELLD